MSEVKKSKKGIVVKIVVAVIIFALGILAGKVVFSPKAEAPVVAVEKDAKVEKKADVKKAEPKKVEAKKEVKK